MKTYIALLRGINVSGKNKILMKDLKLLLEDLKFRRCYYLYPKWKNNVV